MIVVDYDNLNFVNYWRCFIELLLIFKIVKEILIKIVNVFLVCIILFMVVFSK